MNKIAGLLLCFIHTTRHLGLNARRAWKPRGKLFHNALVQKWFVLQLNVRVSYLARMTVARLKVSLKTTIIWFTRSLSVFNEVCLATDTFKQQNFICSVNFRSSLCAQIKYDKNPTPKCNKPVYLNIYIYKNLYILTREFLLYSFQAVFAGRIHSNSTETQTSNLNIERRTQTSLKPSFAC